MLPFGSITSLVPLFILAFAYCIYFSAGLITRHIPCNENPTEKVIIKHADDISYHDFRTFIDDDFEDQVCKTDLSPKQFICISFIEVLRDRPTPVFRIQGFFPRPPPLS
jgi:hypothetical protein